MTNLYYRLLYSHKLVLYGQDLGHIVLLGGWDKLGKGGPVSPWKLLICVLDSCHTHWIVKKFISWSSALCSFNFVRRKFPFINIFNVLYLLVGILLLSHWDEMKTQVRTWTKASSFAHFAYLSICALTCLKIWVNG